MTLETHELTPAKKKFFDKLLSLKKYVKDTLEETGDKNMQEVFDRLNEIINIDETKAPKS